MLRITVDEEGETKWLRLEGRVTGPWAKEFERAWDGIAPTVDGRKFGVDLRGATHIDAHGRRVLADIYGRTRAEFLADTPLTKFFAEEARRSGTGSRKEEE